MCWRSTKLVAGGAIPVPDQALITRWARAMISADRVGFAVWLPFGACNFWHFLNHMARPRAARRAPRPQGMRDTGGGRAGRKAFQGGGGPVQSVVGTGVANLEPRSRAARLASPLRGDTVWQLLDFPLGHRHDGSTAASHIQASATGIYHLHRAFPTDTAQHRRPRLSPCESKNRCDRFRRKVCHGAARSDERRIDDCWL